MDYNKIGAFIEAERKAKKLTQAKLAEKLFVSEKTISKWENGNGVPDTNTLPKMCAIFEVSINELLNGERIASENYTTMAENKLLELQKEKEEKDKMLLKIEVVLGVTSAITFLILLFSSLYAIHKLNILAMPIVMIVFGIAIFIVGCSFCLYIEQKAGYYICAKCNHKHVPTYKQVLFAPHICRTRYLKCPLCHKSSWNKKVIK